MELFLLFIASIIRCLLYAMDFFLIIRVVLSWFPGEIDGKIVDFVFCVTEPLVAFVRSIVMRIRVLRDFPFDLSFMFSYILIGILLTLL